VVVFTSRDRTLVPADLECRPDCPQQVYRFDRDTDGNGIFDERSRRADLAIVSAVDAGVVKVGIAQAGNGSSYSPSVNADGSEIAFVTDSTNLLPSRRGGGGGVTDGDLLVAEFRLGHLRRVLDGPDDIAVPGAHGHSSLSKTGQVVVFESAAARAIRNASTVAPSEGRSIVVAQVTPQLSLADIDFGTVLLGFESTELYANVLNAGPGAFEPIAVESSVPNFKVTGGTCNRGVLVAAGTTCTVKLTFNPTEPRAFSGRLTVRGNGLGAESATATLRGAAGEPALLTYPGGVDFDDGIAGQTAGRIAIDIGNIGFLPVSLRPVTIGGAHPDDFRIVSESCTGNRALNPDAKCAVEVEFSPREAGYRSALLIATTTDGAYTTAVLGGFARYQPLFVVNDSTSAQPGSDIGVGGRGFPPSAVVTIGFGDGSAPLVTTETSPDGTFLASIPLPNRTRLGDRQLVASSSSGVAASAQITVIGAPRSALPAIPGYGLG
jgi:hypothetical protein